MPSIVEQIISVVNSVSSQASNEQITNSELGLRISDAIRSIYCIPNRQTPGIEARSQRSLKLLIDDALRLHFTENETSKFLTDAAYYNSSSTKIFFDNLDKFCDDFASKMQIRYKKHMIRADLFGAVSFQIENTNGRFLILKYEDFGSTFLIESIKENWPKAENIIFHPSSNEINSSEIDFTHVYYAKRSWLLNSKIYFYHYDELLV